MYNSLKKKTRFNFCIIIKMSWLIIVWWSSLWYRNWQTWLHSEYSNYMWGNYRHTYTYNLLIIFCEPYHCHHDYMLIVCGTITMSPQLYICGPICIIVTMTTVWKLSPWLLHLWTYSITVTTTTVNNVHNYCVESNYLTASSWLHLYILLYRRWMSKHVY